jgi:IclR family pca regulon transcriptional regulator
VKKDQASHYSSSLEVGLRLLEVFSSDRQEIGMSEFSAILSSNRSTLYRYVNTLARLGYIVQDSRTKGYRLTSRVLRLGYAALATSPFIGVATPHLSALANRVGHTVNLSVLDGTSILYVARFPKGIDLNVTIGSRLPAYCTSMGKALLAHVGQVELSEILDETEFAPMGPNTITRRLALEAALIEVRSRGYAINDEELTYGLRSVAAPIFAEDGLAVAAANVAVHASTVSFASLVEDLSQQLLATTDQISGSLVGSAARGLGETKGGS